MVVNKNSHQEYWERNIKRFSGFYDKQSEENLKTSSLIAALYKAFLFPIEKRFMLKRYQLVSAFIDQNVAAGMRTAEIGCGNGIFVEKMLRRGAFVYAMDYTKAALDLTESRFRDEEKVKIKFIHSDILHEAIPKVNIAIAIGVLPYIFEPERFFSNILPHTDVFLWNYLDIAHPLNRLRQKVGILDVRSYAYHSKNIIHGIVESYGFKIVDSTPLATGLLEVARRQK